MNQKDRIKTALEERVPAWDDVQLWDRIERELKPKAKKKRLFFFMVMGSMIVSSVSYLSWRQVQDGRRSHHEAVEATASAGSSLLDEQHKALQEERVVKRDAHDPDSTIASHSTINFTERHTRLPAPSISRQLADHSQAVSLTNANLEPITGLTSLASARRNATPPNRRINLKALYEEPHLPDVMSLAAVAIPSLSSPLAGLDNLGASDPESRYELFASAGLYHTSRKLSVDSDVPWLMKKNSVDATLETVDFSLNLRRRLKNNLTLSIGLGVSQTTELMTIVDSLVTTKKIQSDSAIIIITEAGQFYNAGELTETTTVSRTTRTPNKYRALFVPIALGYEMNKGKWTVQVSTGVDIELQRRFEGKILDYDLSVAPAEPLGNSFYNHSVSVANLNFLAGISYDLTDKITISPGFSYKIGLQDYLSSDNHKLRYDKLGLRLATTYKW